MLDKRVDYAAVLVAFDLSPKEPEKASFIYHLPNWTIWKHVRLFARLWNLKQTAGSLFKNFETWSQVFFKLIKLMELFLSEILFEQKKTFNKTQFLTKWIIFHRY